MAVPRSPSTFPSRRRGERRSAGETARRFATLQLAARRSGKRAAVEHVDIARYVDALELDFGKVVLGDGVADQQEQRRRSDEDGTRHGESVALLGWNGKPMLFA